MSLLRDIGRMHPLARTRAETDRRLEREKLLDEGAEAPRTRPTYIDVRGPSIFAHQLGVLPQWQRGVSIEAEELFREVQKAGGALDLRTLQRWVRLEELERLVDELGWFGVVERRTLKGGGPGVALAPGVEESAVLVGGGWRRWH